MPLISTNDNDVHEQLRILSIFTKVSMGKLSDYFLRRELNIPHTDLDLEIEKAIQQAQGRFNDWKENKRK